MAVAAMARAAPMGPASPIATRIARREPMVVTAAWAGPAAPAPRWCCGGVSTTGAAPRFSPMAALVGRVGLAERARMAARSNAAPGLQQAAAVTAARAAPVAARAR